MRRAERFRLTTHCKAGIRQTIAPASRAGEVAMLLSIHTTDRRDDGAKTKEVRRQSQ